MSTISPFRSTENKHDVYRGKICMKKFHKSLREHAIEIIHFKKKKMKLLTNSSTNQVKMQKFIIFVKKRLKINMLKIKTIINLGTTVIMQGNTEVLHIACIF